MSLYLSSSGLEKLQHEHPLELVDLQPNYPLYKEYEEDDDDSDEEGDDTKWDFCRPCNQCGKEINLYQRYYYKCSRNSCDYFLHKWCGELSTSISRRTHSDLCFDDSAFSYNRLRMSHFMCDICHTYRLSESLFYGCDKCHLRVHVECVIASRENRIIYHPSHPHPLVRATTGHKRPISYHCDACGKEHMGDHLYLCPTCFDFSIQSDCLFLPKIKPTTRQRLHTHLLILSYSFPLEHQEAEFWPKCRICGEGFGKQWTLWIYKCEKCRYYVHLHCIKSKGDNFISETRKDYSYYKSDYRNILNLPFRDQTDSIHKHLLQVSFFKQKELTTTHHHQHPLRLVHSISNQAISSSSSIISLHNPREKMELLCDGCVRPITSMPFFQCTDDDGGGQGFVFHEWCTRLPPKLEHHYAHYPHTLTFLPKVPRNLLGVFKCSVCLLPCNGFAYGCEICKDFYIDVTCAFMPAAITHDAHPNHLFLRYEHVSNYFYCLACLHRLSEGYWVHSFEDYKVSRFTYKCRTCKDVYLHPECALLLPKTIEHKYDKHPMKLSYMPIENHKSEYICEICEAQFDPNKWFYHCSDGRCAQSMHPQCAPLILQSEREAEADSIGVYKFVNIKFGRVVDNIKGHSHSLVFTQGIADDGPCVKCGTGARFGR